MAAEGAVTATGSAPADLPHRVSWVDRLTRAIERLPGPAWAFYAFAFVLAVLLVNGPAWLLGALPWWTFDPDQTGYAPGAVLMLALMHYLNGVARAKLEAYRPALDGSEREYERLEREFTTLPARETTLVTLLGVVLVLVFYATELPGTDLSSVPLVFVVSEVGLNVIASALLAVLVYHTVRQLRLVSRAHALAPRVDLFEPAPLYAFSHLTARTGVGLMLLVAYSYLVDPVSSAQVDIIDIALTMLVLGLAAAAFVLPLEGMHHRIVAEKERLLLESDRRLKVALDELHAAVDRRDLSVADPLSKMLDSLKIEREAIVRMPTWPWEPGTLRAFVTALLVPVVLWLIIRGLERFV